VCTYLAVCGAIFLDGPAGFGADGFEDFVVVAVFGEFVVAVEAEAGEDLGGDGAAAALAALVVLPLLPRGQARAGRHGCGARFGQGDSSLDAINPANAASYTSLAASHQTAEPVRVEVRSTNVSLVAVTSQWPTDWCHRWNPWLRRPGSPFRSPRNGCELRERNWKPATCNVIHWLKLASEERREGNPYKHGPEFCATVRSSTHNLKEVKERIAPVGRLSMYKSGTNVTRTTSRAPNLLTTG
jgi:hypothetical protein